MAAKFNSPIERLGHTSGITGWGWVFISALGVGLLTAGWFGYIYWQQLTSSMTPQSSGLTVGTHDSLAYVQSIEQHDSRYYATVDPVEWLVGDEARRQALADGLCQASSTNCLDHGFYLRNSATTTEMVLLNEQAPILMQTLSTTASGTPQWDEAISFDRWQNLFLDPNSRWHRVPFRLSIRDNEVMTVREQYLP